MPRNKTEEADVHNVTGSDIMVVEVKDDLDRRLSADANLSPVARHIAQFIRENREFVVTATAAAIGVKAGASDATVLRTIQMLGFSGIAELKQTILESAGSTTSSADDMRGTLADLKASTSNAIDNVMQAHRDGFAVLQSKECRNQIAAAVETLDAASRIVIFGIGPSASLANHIAYLMARSGRRTRTLDVTGAMLANQLLDLRRGDALLILAYGRLYKEVGTVFA
jgi:DNA-binding MurR/RpiR family transcriptional regulator